MDHLKVVWTRNFTTEEWSSMNKCLRRKQKYEDRLVKVQGKILKIHADYCAIVNSRTPILSLPNEVTSLIFDYAQVPASLDALGRHVDKGELHEKDQYLMEVVVSHVCQHWRSVSLGYPNLWTKFYLHPKYKIDYIPYDRFTTYLWRSKSLPLYLWLDFRNVVDDSSLALLLHEALDHVARWKQFTIYGDDHLSVVQWLCRLQRLRAPMLEYFVVSPGFPIYEIGPPVADLGAHIFAGGVPNLKLCVLDDYALLEFIPPLRNITTLRLHQRSYEDLNITPQFVVDVLSLPSLQHLSFLGDFPEPQTALHQIKMPNLEHLEVSQCCGMWCYFQSIRAPHLKTLLFHHSHFGPNAHASRTYLLDQYSFPALKKLWIVNSTMAMEVVDDLVKMTIEATDVFIAGNTSTFFDRVREYADKEKLWPRLSLMTTDIHELISVEPYLTFARNRFKGFTLRLHPKLLSHWTKKDSRRLGGFCTLKAINEDDLACDVESFWPKDMKGPLGFEKYVSEEPSFIDLVGPKIP